MTETFRPSRFDPLRRFLFRWSKRAAVAAIAAFALLWTAERVIDYCDPLPMRVLTRWGESRRVFAADGALLRVTPTVWGERLIHVRLAEVSPHLIHALLSSEDRRFNDHSGVDFGAAARAVASSFMNARVTSGASTITMQFARTVEPHERTFVAKLKEMVRARQIERALSKDEILEGYINNVFLGGTLRGFEAASLYWFGKSAKDLLAHEAATLVAMLPAPSRRSPEKAPSAVLEARNRVLDRMLAEDQLTPAEHRRAAAAPLGASVHPWPFMAPHATDLALSRAEGPTVKTAIEMPLQAAVEQIVRTRTDPEADGVAAVVMTRATGDIRALVGSRDYRKNPLNAAVQRRSAGSTVKPFLYGLALSRGVVAPESLIADTPVSFGSYRPKNFSEDYAGRISVADALVASRNVPAVRLLEQVGCSRFQALLTRVGLASREPLGLDAALGTIAVSPLELARAYRRLADEDASGLSETARRRLLEILSRESPDPGVLDAGETAWKTGTSSGRRDAWSVGITRADVIVVWEGRLSGRPASSLVGRRAAAPVLAAIVAASAPHAH